MLFMYAAMIDDEVDQLRFADIYHGYRKQMLLVAKRVLNNDEDAEDAVQIAFLGIAQRIKSVPSDDPKKLRAYVLTAAKNAALFVLLQNDGAAVYINFQRVLLCDAECAAKLGGKHDPPKLVNFSYDPGCFHSGIPLFPFLLP